MTQTHQLTITIYWDAANRAFYSKTDWKIRKVKDRDIVSWAVDWRKGKDEERPEFPLDTSEFVLRFPAGTCVRIPPSGDLRFGKGQTTQTAFVGNSNPGRYKYDIYYADAGGTEHLLEDPELVIEGN